MPAHEMTEQEFLQNYRIHDFDVPLTSVDLVIFTLQEQCLKVLLVERGEHPHKGRWALPGGFIDLKRDKDLDATASRKLREKTGVDVSYLEQLQGFGSATRDPRGWSATFAYFALIDAQGVTLSHGGGSSAASWVSVDALSGRRDLAFDHADIVDVALQRLRGKVEYTSLPVHLLAPEFTLSDLQQVYEAILGRAVDKSAFRKRIKEGDFLQEIAGKQRHGSNRPAQLYRLREGPPLVYFNRTMSPLR